MIFVFPAEARVALVKLHFLFRQGFPLYGDAAFEEHHLSILLETNRGATDAEGVSASRRFTACLLPSSPLRDGLNSRRSRGIVSGQAISPRRD